MTEWEAKYKAILQGISDESYVQNAEALVKAAMEFSLRSPASFEESFQAMRSVVYCEQTKATKEIASPMGGRRIRRCSPWITMAIGAIVGFACGVGLLMWGI